MRMIQCGNGAGLVLEAFGEAGLEGLDGDGARQSRVLGPVNLAHSSGAEPLADAIGPDHRTGGEGDLGRATSQHVVRDPFNRLAEEFAPPAVLPEQLFHLTAEALVALAGLCQESWPHRGLAL
jgi:hypothetical protein